MIPAVRDQARYVAILAYKLDLSAGSYLADMGYRRAAKDARDSRRQSPRHSKEQAVILTSMQRQRKLLQAELL